MGLINLNALPKTACSPKELLLLSTLEHVEKGLTKTWNQSSEILNLIQRFANVDPWRGPIDGAYFQVRTTRSTVITSVHCKDPFPIPERRKGQRIGYSPKLYVDGIDSCLLDELGNRDPGKLFDDLKEEMDAFKEDSMAGLNWAAIYGDGKDTPKHMDTATVQAENPFNGPGLDSTFIRGTGYGLLSILGDDTLRPEYLTLSGADDGCEFWRAGIYDADELSQLDPDDAAYWDGHLDFTVVSRFLNLRRTQGSKYIAITDPETYLKIRLSALRRSQDPRIWNPFRNGTFQGFPQFEAIEYDGVTYVQDMYWPANSIGIFDFNEIWFRPVPELWMKNTGWQAGFNTPLQKYLWEMWAFALYTKRRNAHILICNPIIDDFCQCVNVQNADAIGAAIAEALA
jgi:hypothetical protein